MGDFADDAFIASMDEELRHMNDAFQAWPYDPRFRRAAEVNTDIEHQLTRLRQQLKARGETNAFLRIRPRIDD